MKKHFTQICTLAMLLISSPWTFQANAQPYTVESEFQKLVSHPANYGDVGRICEELARLRFEEKYSNADYRIIVGLKYFNHTRTVGELDIVVFDRSNDLAILVGEVKCWQNIEGALNKAHKQLDRFKRYVSNEGAISHFSGDEAFANHIEEWQFEIFPPIATVAQNGSKKRGFTHEIGLTLEQAMELRKRLMACQRSGSCPTRR